MKLTCAVHGTYTEGDFTAEVEISVILADQFTGGTYLLAAYTEQGRMLAVRVDETFSPTAEGETLWTQ